MVMLEEHVRFISGSPQFRITETTNASAPSYRIYSQTDLFDDLSGVKSNSLENKVIRTEEQVSTLFAGDIIFSLISGNACMVSKAHEGYLYTQNYIKMFIDASIDSRFLLYLLNEDTTVRQQLHVGLQGSITLKYTLKQLKAINLPSLPSLNKQKIIGNIYLNQLKIQALKRRVAEAESSLLLYRLEEVMRDERKSI